MKLNHSKKTELARALSKMGIASRTVAAEMIVSGKVRIGTKIIRDPEYPVVFPIQNLFIQNQKALFAQKVYFMMHKPKGVVTTRNDEKGRKTVYDLLPSYFQGSSQTSLNTPEPRTSHWQSQMHRFNEISWIFPVGRLDKESSGLLLLTNDTAWADKIVSPISKLPKTYHVKINRPIKEVEVLKIRTGLKLSDELSYLPINIEKIRENIKSCWLELTLVEGKNRQIRKSFEHLGYRVENLVRIRIGKLELGALKPGEFRPISPDEVGISLS